MNIDNIKALAEILSQNNLTSIEVAEGENVIRLEKNISQVVQTIGAMPMPQNGISMENGESKAENSELNFSNLTEVKSPLVGVFYSAPSPESPPFVTIGSKVKKGDVLCIVEAMKLMNEVTSEADGEIVDICLKNGDVAEYGQVLFKIF